MKRTLLLSSLMLPILGMSQVIFQDDFEAYANGAYIAENSNGAWTTWSNAPGGTEDAPASTDFAHSGTISAKFASPTANGPTDFVYNYGDLTSGRIATTFWMYVPATNGAYFNFMHLPYPPGEWAVDIYFGADGIGNLTLNSTDIAFTFPHDEWFEVSLDANMDTDAAEFFLNGTSVHTWQWSIQNNAATGTNQLSWLDLFAAAPTGTPSLYYVDDVTIESLPSGIGYAELFATENAVAYPSPAADVVTVAMESILTGNASIEVYNAAGERVSPPVAYGANKVRVDVAGLATGVYSVLVRDGAVRVHERFVKN